VVKSKATRIAKTRPPRWLGRWVVPWLACAALWLLFSAKLSVDELVASLIAATFACVGIAVVRSADRTPFRPTRAMLIQAWRIPGDLLDGAWKVFGGMARFLAGRGWPQGALRTLQTDLGPEDDPKCNARRALVITYTTITPNTVVIGFVPEQDLMLLHQFVATDELKIAKSLEASR